MLNGTTRNRVITFGASARADGGVLVDGAINPAFDAVIELALIVIHKA